MKNFDIRIAMGNITQKEIACLLDVTPMTISRWFNKEMNEVQRYRVMGAINQLKTEREREKSNQV